jgi:hypothetical protein
MILNVVVDGQSTPVDVPQDILTEAVDVFKKMDADMDKGWQMSHSWVENLNAAQRCQVAGDRILTALEHENKSMLLMMSAYILQKLPGVSEIHISTNGDMSETEVVVNN